MAQNDLLFQSLHTEKRQKLPLQMTFRRPGDEYEKTKAKAQTLISPHHAGVLVDDEAQTRICLHPERESQGGRDSDLSPPRRRPQGGRGSDSDLSAPRRTRSPDGQAVSSGFMLEDPLYQWSH